MLTLVAGRLGRGAGRRISSAQPRLWLDPGGRRGRRDRRAARAGLLLPLVWNAVPLKGVPLMGCFIFAARDRGAISRCSSRPNPKRQCSRSPNASASKDYLPLSSAARDAAPDVRRHVLHAWSRDHRAALSFLLRTGARLHAGAGQLSASLLHRRRSVRCRRSGRAWRSRFGKHQTIRIASVLLRRRAVEPCWCCPKRMSAR